MKRIKVLTDQCIGCGACVGIDPEHFDFNDDGLSHVISEENLDSLALQEAIDSCPVAIISLEESNEELDTTKEVPFDLDENQDMVDLSNENTEENVEDLNKIKSETISNEDF